MKIAFLAKIAALYVAMSVCQSVCLSLGQCQWVLNDKRKHEMIMLQCCLHYAMYGIKLEKENAYNKIRITRFKQ